MAEIIWTMGLSLDCVIIGLTVYFLTISGRMLWRQHKRNRHLNALGVNTSRGRNGLWERSGY